MSLNASENFHPKIERDKNERSIEEIGDKLSRFCEENSNSIEFHRLGSERLTVIPRLREFQQESGLDYRDTLEIIKNGMVEFLHNPIFTDTFHEDHSARRLWEEKSEKKMIESGLYGYYNSNCLNSHCWSIITVLQYMNQDPNSHYPAKLVTKLNDIFSQSGNDIPDKDEYHSYSDEEKIASMAKIELVIKKILNVICVESEN